MKASHLRPPGNQVSIKSPHFPHLKARKLMLLRISNAELERNVKKSVEGS